MTTAQNIHGPQSASSPLPASQAAAPSAGPSRHAYADNSFASRVFAPATQWYDEMRWTRERPATNNRKRLELLISYLPDWVATLLIAGLLQIINKVDGFRREFSLTDASIQHTYTLHERVTVGELAVYAFIIPLALMALLALGISRSVWDFHAGLLGLVVAHAFTLTATTIIKVCVGRPRPDLLDRCQPIPAAQNGQPYGLVTQMICTTPITSSIIRDGFRSFPSGHSSTAFAGLTFLTLWLAGKFHLWQRSRGNALSAWLLFVPMLGATLIAVSRTMDYRHHATDVIAGGILGFVIAVSVYHSYYPPLWHTHSHKPWAPRTSFFTASDSTAVSRAAKYSGASLDSALVCADGPAAEHDIERNPLRHHQRTRSGESQTATASQFVPHGYRDDQPSPSEELELARSSD